MRKIEYNPIAKILTDKEKKKIFNGKCPGNNNGYPCDAPLRIERVIDFEEDVYCISCHYGHSHFFFKHKKSFFKHKKSLFDLISMEFRNRKENPIFHSKLLRIKQ
jgi:hypothetical protein